MNKKSLPFLYAGLINLSAIMAATVPEDLSSRIASTAVQALKPPHLKREKNRVLLYGQRINGADTREGDWACAKVVSIVLREAGVVMDVELGVAGIEKSLGSWEKITSKTDLRPGDVVVWTRRWKPGKNGACVGKGTCHVGIFTTKGYVHNNPLSDHPTLNGIGLWAFKFKSAYRAPQKQLPTPFNR